MTTRNFTAEAAIGQFRLVEFGAADGTVKQASALTSKIIGVCVQPGGVAAGERVDVQMSGVVDLEAGAAWTRGDLLSAEGLGRGFATTGQGGRSGAVALTNAGAAGEIRPVLICLGIL